MLIIKQIKSSTVNMEESNLIFLPVTFTSWKRSREFIRKHDYQLDMKNPFLDGDKLAKNLVEKVDHILPPPSDEQLTCEHNPDSGDMKEELNSEFNSDEDIDYNDEDEFNQDNDSDEWDSSEEKQLIKKSSKKSEKAEVTQTKKFRDWSKYKRINGKIKCNHCEKVFNHKRDVGVHEDEFHCENPGQFICDICGKCWNTFLRLRKHKRDVHKLRADGSVIKSKRIRKIQKITKEFTKERKPIRNWSEYEKIEGKIKCGFCEKVFSNKKAVRVHENEYHCSDPGQFVCDICGSSWNSHAGLRQHRREAHYLRPDGSSIEKKLAHTCHICGKGFRTPSKLTRHMRSHKDKK